MTAGKMIKEILKSGRELDSKQFEELKPLRNS